MFEKFKEIRADLSICKTMGYKPDEDGGYDSLQGIVEPYDREKLMKADLEKRQPVYLPKMSAHILRRTFCTRMWERDVSLKILQDIMERRSWIHVMANPETR